MTGLPTQLDFPQMPPGGFSDFPSITRYFQQLTLSLNYGYAIMGDRVRDASQRGVIADRPPATGASKLYLATDSGKLSFDAGSWLDVGRDITPGADGIVHNVLDYGANGDGTGDDSGAIQSAIDGIDTSVGGVVYFPGGNYRITSGLVADFNRLTMRGDGMSSIINYIPAAGHTLSIGSATQRNGIVVEDLWFTQGVSARAGGAAIYLNNTARTTIRGCYFTDQFKGIHCDSTSIVRILACGVNDLASGGIAIDIGGDGDAVLIDHLMVDNATPTGTGIHVDEYDTVHITNSHLVRCKYGLLCNPASGKYVVHLFVCNSAFDTNSADGIRIQPTGTGYVARSAFSNSWASGNANYGITFGSTGTINTIQFDNMRVYYNGLAGAFLNGGSDWAIQNSMFGGNSKAASGADDGIKVNSGVSNFQLIGNRCGNIGGFSNTQRYGINVLAGASDWYIVANNHCNGNVTGNVNDGGAGANKVVAQNL